MILTGLAMAITIAGALIAATRRNIVHAVFGLAIALLGVALCFLALHSPFVAAMQVLIYIGGITIAMIFAVMLSGSGLQEQRESPARRLIAALAAFAFFLAIAPTIINADFGPAARFAPEIIESEWSLKIIGDALLDRFNVVFELLSIVLLLAIVGAIAIARHDRADDADPTAPESPAGNGGRP